MNEGKFNESLPDELGLDEDGQAVDAVHAAMEKALREAESRDGRAPPSDQAVLAWRTAIEDFEDGYSLHAAILTLGLRDAGGHELPAEARNFFHGLMARMLENKKRRGLPRREVRVRFKIHCEAEREKDRSSRPRGVSVPEKVMKYLSDIYGCGVSSIDEIVKPRASRPHIKRLRVLGEPD